MGRRTRRARRPPDPTTRGCRCGSRSRWSRVRHRRAVDDRRGAGRLETPAGASRRYRRRRTLKPFRYAVMFAGVADGQAVDVGASPSRSIDLERRGLLALDARRVHRVHQRHRVVLGQLARGEAVVEVAVDLQQASRRAPAPAPSCRARSCPAGTSTAQTMPALTAYAAALADVLPVDAQMTAFAPPSAAFEMAIVMPRSLGKARGFRTLDLDPDVAAGGSERHVGVHQQLPPSRSGRSACPDRAGGRGTPRSDRATGARPRWRSRPLLALDPHRRTTARTASCDRSALDRRGERQSCARCVRTTSRASSPWPSGARSGCSRRVGEGLRDRARTPGRSATSRFT